MGGQSEKLLNLKCINHLAEEITKRKKKKIRHMTREFPVGSPTLILIKHIMTSILIQQEEKVK